MRELSDQEIKDLYESEYRSEAPELWIRIEERISREEQDSPEEVLHFAKLGKKRWIKVIASAAACFLILGAYVLQQGGLSLSEKDSGALSTEASYDVLREESIEEMPADVSETNTGSDLDGSYDLTAESYLNINGEIYVYYGQADQASRDMGDMECLGEVSCQDSQSYPSEHLTVTNMDISGKVYFDAEGEAYIVDDEVGRIYIYVLLQE